MSKDVFFRKEAMEKMVRGMNVVADVVGGTIGPKGLNVFVDDQYTPKFTNDGAKIANKIILEDKVENAGGYLIRNTASQQNDDVGDGTTTVTVLTQANVKEALSRPENPVLVSESLIQAGNKILKILAKKAIKITKKDIEKVALISAENKDLARLITEIVNKLGDKAVINVEDSKTFATDYEIVDGYEAQVGFASPYFANSEKTGKATYEDVPVLVSEKKIANIADIAPIFDKFKEAKISSCVIVCDDIDDAIMGVFVANKIAGRFNTLVIKAHGDVLRDIEGATRAKAVSDANGVTFAKLDVKHLGQAKKVVCDANKTLFIGNGTAAKLYAAQLERTIDNEPNMYRVQMLKDRVAKLRGGVAVLKIGGSTDFEREYLKDKAEDAVKAVLAAVAEGVVEGGGMTLWRIAQELQPKTIGEEILKRSMTAPLRKIVENAGKDYAEIIKKMPDGMGYDAKNDKYVDMIKEGIIDPAKVERCALENSVSSSAKFITSFATITDSPEKK